MKRNERGQISREILEYLLIGGVVILALSTAPYVLAAAIPIARFQKRQSPKRKLQNSFYYLQKKGLIAVRSHHGKVYIALTEAGRKRALKRSILTTVTIERPHFWDKKWRIVLFDIETGHTIKRNALRSMLRKVGFIQLQKSVWIYPFDCRDAVNQLKEFFNFSENECRLIVSSDIGGDIKFRKYFRI